MNMVQLDQISLYVKAIPEPIKKRYSEELFSKGVEVILDTRGMVMMSVLDCFDSAFHLGEVLARQVKIKIDNKIGTAIVLGDSFDDAFIAACAQLAQRIKHKELLIMITDFIQTHTHYRSEIEVIDRGIAESTKVNFGIMVEG